MRLLERVQRMAAAGGLLPALTLGLAGAAAAAAPGPPENGHARIPAVLLLFPLRSNAPVLTTMVATYREKLETALRGPIDLHVEYLDLPDAADTAYGRRLTELLREKYAGRPIEVVVAHRIEALTFLQQNRGILFPGASVVFMDVARQDLGNDPLTPNTTGIFLEAAGQRTVRVALDLHPDARRVVIVGGASPLDRGNEAFARRLAADRAPQLEVVSLHGIGLEEQLEHLAHLPEDSVVVFTSYRADPEGRSTVARDVFRRLAQASNSPVYGASESFLGIGIVGGDVIRYGPLAEHAAGLTARILRGEKASEIAPEEMASTQLMFDWRQLKRWGIDEDHLPPGSVVVHREQTLWSQYRGRILLLFLALVVQTAAIVALLRERRTRRAREEELRAAEQRYRTVADFTNDWEYWRRPTGELAWISPSCERTTGHAPEQFYDRPELLSEIIVEEDREAWEVHRREAQAAKVPQGLEFRIQARDGSIRWIDHICANVADQEGEFLGVRGSNRDITRRKQSELDLATALAEVGRLRDRFEADNTYLREQLEPEHGFEGVLGSSNPMRYVFSRAQQVAVTSSTVLLLGETGVGKDVIARAIHRLSPRHGRPLVTLNCAALPPSLIESELFGHERGAFTGATGLRKGRFEVADGGTLFLDEIGELPIELQAKLLRVIQDGEFERVGGSATLKADIRLIAATNRHLDEEVKAGRFRSDLWYRLNVFPITVPPLRQRREDIPLLVRHFVEKHCRKTGKPPLEVSRATMQDLQQQDWPGNVRELESVVERAVITSLGPLLRLEPFPSAAAAAFEHVPEAAGTLTEREREHILTVLDQTFWRLEGSGGAAERLGMNPSTLRSRMRKHGIRRPTARPGFAG